MSQTHFYALKDDLIPMFETVESKGALKYVLAGRSLSSKIQSFVGGAELPNLGEANCESSIGCVRYLVCDPKLQIEVRVVNQSDGVRSFHIDQLFNPDTITFWPGGKWTEDILLYGCVGTASDSESSKRLMNRFRYGLKKHFSNIRGAYVGSAALEELKAGRRLTLAAQTPREFDLVLP